MWPTTAISSEIMHSELLDETSVGSYAIERGVIPEGPWQASLLAGGVSNVVLLVESGQKRFVVKQALSRLRVADEWLADPARAQAEAAAIRVLHDISPDAVPELLDDHPERHALIISAAPSHWLNWKDQLLGGIIDPRMGSRLGQLLSQWHSATDGAPLPDLLEGLTMFEQLRLAPYFGMTGKRRPHMRGALDEVAAAIRSRQRCLVLGDFSPKNILVGGDDDTGLWVIDLEVAHRGDPAFDVAFMLSHLAAKAIHLPVNAQALGITATAFMTAYGRGPAMEDQEHLSRVFAGLLLARVHGSSQLEYLTPPERIKLADSAERLLGSSAQTLAEAWNEVTEP